MVDLGRGGITTDAASHDSGTTADLTVDPDGAVPGLQMHHLGADGHPDDYPAGRSHEPHLVPLEVARSKFAEQLQRWEESVDIYTRRGWVILHTSDLQVVVAFITNVQMAGRQVPVVTACVRLDYWNFDIWPPSVTFIDPVTREATQPAARAPEGMGVTGEPRDVLIDGHPSTGLPFLCLPGIREYHSHPQHSGDNWLLHRDRREGDLAVICERIWRRMSRNVLGLGVTMQSLPIGTQLDVSLLQGDADLMGAHIDAQRAAQSMQMGQAAAARHPSMSPETSPAPPETTSPVNVPEMGADQPHA